MAGDWIKLEHATPDKPEVFQIAEHLGIDPDAVTGKLFRIWIWADQQTRDGNARGVTRSLLDRLASVPGFADALEKVGWIAQGESGLTFVNFERHNGKTAKARALTNKRVDTHRKRGSNGESVTTALPEKRRDNSVGADSPPSVDAALYAEARGIFGQSIGGQINKAIKAKGKGWVVEICEQCRGKDPEAARAYLTAALNGKQRKERGFVF